MNKGFYFGLAFQNIRKNKKTYFPYLLTSTFMAAMYYIVYALSDSKNLDKIANSQTLEMFLKYGRVVMGVFSVIFLFYTFSFLIKRRKKEFGIYNILGMEKKHIAKFMLFESSYSYLISTAIGIVSGILFSKVFYLILAKIVKFEYKGDFEFSLSAFLATIILFFIIFALTYLNALRQIHLSKPVELLSGSNVGEKEPKTKFIMAIIGFICLGIAYYIASSSQFTTMIIINFLYAVILVIIGTFLLFTAGSIFILKLLRKNKNYYYKTSHFTAVSGMIYRMKQNAAGLASICILSTMVLVMLSSTVSLYMGMSDTMNTRFVQNQQIEFSEISSEKFEKNKEEVLSVASKHNSKVDNLSVFRYKDFRVLGDENKITHTTEKNFNNPLFGMVLMITLDDYNKMTNKNETLNDDEVLALPVNASLNSTFKIENNSYKIKKIVDDIDYAKQQETLTFKTFFIVFKDEKAVNTAENALSKQNKIKDYTYVLAFDSDLTSKDQITFTKALDKTLTDKNTYVSGKEEFSEAFYSIYGGLFFLGIFLGLIFIMATALIIYYKQISEGYDDKNRFKIMQNVGMSKKEVKKSIHSQVLTVFFLPLIMAFIHLAFSFPIISTLLKGLGLTNIKLFILCLIGTCLIFTLFYTIIYSLTARTYYKIVSEK